MLSAQMAAILSREPSINDEDDLEHDPLPHGTDFLLDIYTALIMTQIGRVGVDCIGTEQD